MAMSNETKVGLLVVVALGALAWVSVKSGSFGISGATGDMRTLTSTFTNVEGIKDGSRVKVAGVDVGDVKSVELQPNGTAVLTMEVEKSVALPADVTAQITTSGLIGERFVSLVPGPNGAMGDGGMLTADKAVIPGGSGGSASPQDIGNNFAQVADDLKEMTGQLKSVLGSPENAQKLQQIIDGMAAFSNKLGEGGTMDNISRIAANFEKVSDQLASGKGPLGQLIMGTGDTSGTMGSLADLGAAAKEFREVMAKINNGEGTLGKLVNDSATAEKLDTALDTFSEVSDRVNQLRTEVNFEANSLVAEHGIGKGEFNLTLQPRPTRFYTVGVTADGFASAAKSANDVNGPYFGKDFGNKSKITAQFGQVFQDVAGTGQDLAVRVGLKNSSGGIGLDTYGKVPVLDSNVKYSVDAYDFGGADTPGSSSPHVDLAARADLIGKTVYGVVGYDNVLNQEYGSPMVGLGVKFQDDDLKYVLGKAL